MSVTSLYGIDPSPIYLGIDPGAQGAIALLCGDRVEVLNLKGVGELQVWEWLRKFSARGNGVYAQAVIEKVGGYMPGSGGNIGSAMFNFGVSYGRLRMALVCAGIEFNEVVPGAWQRALGVKARGKEEGKSEFKRRLRDYASLSFSQGDCVAGGLRVTLQNCDALLLALYCKRKGEGLL